MRARLLRLLDQIQTGFWFIPLLMLAAASALAVVLVGVDRWADPGFEASIRWAYTGDAEGARSLLSTIAGSMITAASVTFSLAAVALSIASQQYGSRVLRNFMRDRITQVLLGTFIATFVYCVLVVRAIRGTDAGGGFVPAISVTVAIGLSVVSLVLLIYFIHHISASIQASHIVRVIGDDLRKAIPRLYPPKEGGAQTGSGEERGPPVGQDSMVVKLPGDGYIQTIDIAGLMEVATARNLVIELIVKPGDHLLPGTKVARISGTGELPEHELKRVTECFLLGRERTPVQDIRYQFQQLTEVVIRALSPGINDPFTAVNGIDELATGIALLVCHARSNEELTDEHGELRLVLRTAQIGEVLRGTVGHIALYAADDPFVMAGLRRILDAAAGGLAGEVEHAVASELMEELNRRDRNKTGP